MSLKSAWSKRRASSSLEGEAAARVGGAVVRPGTYTLTANLPAFHKNRKGDDLPCTIPKGMTVTVETAESNDGAVNFYAHAMVSVPQPGSVFTLRTSSYFYAMPDDFRAAMSDDARKPLQKAKCVHGFTGGCAECAQFMGVDPDHKPFKTTDRNGREFPCCSEHGKTMKSGPAQEDIVIPEMKPAERQKKIDALLDRWQMEPGARPQIEEQLKSLRAMSALWMLRRAGDAAGKLEGSTRGEEENIAQALAAEVILPSCREIEQRWAKGLNDIKEPINLSVNGVWLVGSRLSGGARSKSDWDFVVTFTTNPAEDQAGENQDHLIEMMRMELRLAAIRHGGAGMSEQFLDFFPVYGTDPGKFAPPIENPNADPDDPDQFGEATEQPSMRVAATEPPWARQVLNALTDLGTWNNHLVMSVIHDLTAERTIEDISRERGLHANEREQLKTILNQFATPTSSLSDLAERYEVKAPYDKNAPQLAKAPLPEGRYTVVEEFFASDRMGQSCVFNPGSILQVVPMTDSLVWFQFRPKPGVILGPYKTDEAHFSAATKREKTERTHPSELSDSGIENAPAAMSDKDRQTKIDALLEEWQAKPDQRPQIEQRLKSLRAMSALWMLRRAENNHTRLVLTDKLRCWDRVATGQGAKVQSWVLPKGTSIEIINKFNLEHGGSPEMARIMFWPPEGAAGAGLPTRGAGIVRAGDLRYASTENVPHKDGDSNVECDGCGRTDLPLHTDGRCPGCSKNNPVDEAPSSPGDVGGMNDRQRLQRIDSLLERWQKEPATRSQIEEQLKSLRAMSALWNIRRADRRNHQRFVTADQEGRMSSCCIDHPLDLEKEYANYLINFKLIHANLDQRRAEMVQKGDIVLWHGTTADVASKVLNEGVTPQWGKFVSTHHGEGGKPIVFASDDQDLSSAARAMMNAVAAKIGAKEGDVRGKAIREHGAMLEVVFDKIYQLTDIKEVSAHDPDQQSGWGVVDAKTGEPVDMDIPTGVEWGNFFSFDPGQVVGVYVGDDLLKFLGEHEEELSAFYGGDFYDMLTYDASMRSKWRQRRAKNDEQKLLRELVCTVIGSDSGTTNEAVLPKGTVVGVQPWSNDHTIFFYSPFYSRMIVNGRVMKGNQYSAPVQDFRAATDIGYGEGTGYEHGPECFCEDCMANDDMSTHRCPTCGSRECPGDGHSIDCRKPGTMTLKDVPTETKDSLLDKFNRGEIDEATLRRRMKQLHSSLRARWMARRAAELPDMVWRVPLFDGRGGQSFSTEALANEYFETAKKEGKDPSSPEFIKRPKGHSVQASKPIDWDHVRAVAQQVRGQFVTEQDKPSKNRCVEINKALAQALRAEYGDAVALRYGPFTDDRGGEFHHWWVEIAGRVIDAAVDQFNPGIIDSPMPEIYIGKRGDRYRAESFYSGDEIDQKGSLTRAWLQRRAAEIRRIGTIVVAGKEYPLYAEPRAFIAYARKAADATSMPPLAPGLLAFAMNQIRKSGLPVSPDVEAAVAQELKNIAEDLAVNAEDWGSMEKMLGVDDFPDRRASGQEIKTWQHDGNEIVAIVDPAVPIDPGFYEKGDYRVPPPGVLAFVVMTGDVMGLAATAQEHRRKGLFRSLLLHVLQERGEIRLEDLEDDMQMAIGNMVDDGTIVEVESSEPSRFDSGNDKYIKLASGINIGRARQSLLSAWKKRADAKHGDDSDRGHDYDFGWDYEVEEKPDAKLVQMTEAIAADLMKTLIPKLGMFSGFEIGYLENSGSVAVFIASTASYPMIGIDLQATKEAMAEFPENYMAGALRTSIVHELAHAIQESQGMSYGEEEAESFARDFDDGIFTEFWKKKQRRQRRAAGGFFTVCKLQIEKKANDPIRKVVTINGVKVGIEWPKGTVRTWDHLPNNDYRVKMKADYGYIRGTEGDDGEEVDVYGGPNRDSDRVFVVEQLKDTGGYDEEKYMLGYEDKAEAKKSYLDHMDADKLGKITEMPWEKFLDLVPKSQKKVEEKTGRAGKQNSGQERQSLFSSWVKRQASESNPDQDDDMFAFQDSNIESLPKLLQDIDESNQLGIRLENAGDIFRELVWRDYADPGYIGEKVGKIRRHLTNPDMTRDLPHEAMVILAQIIDLFNSIDLAGKSPILIAARDLNLALAHQDMGRAATLLPIFDQVGQRKAFGRRAAVPLPKPIDAGGDYIVYPEEIGEPWQTKSWVTPNGLFMSCKNENHEDIADGYTKTIDEMILDGWIRISIGSGVNFDMVMPPNPAQMAVIEKVMQGNRRKMVIGLGDSQDWGSFNTYGEFDVDALAAEGKSLAGEIAKFFADPAAIQREKDYRALIDEHGYPREKDELGQESVLGAWKRRASQGIDELPVVYVENDRDDLPRHLEEDGSLPERWQRRAGSKLDLLWRRWTKNGGAEAKAAFHNEARAVLIRMANALGLDQSKYDLRSNKAGSAVMGEVTLHSDDVYIQVSGSGLMPGKEVMYRTVKNRKDYTGGQNNFMSFDDAENAQQAAAKVESLFSKGKGLQNNTRIKGRPMQRSEPGSVTQIEDAIINLLRRGPSTISRDSSELGIEIDPRAHDFVSDVIGRMLDRGQIRFDGDTAEFSLLKEPEPTAPEHLPEMSEFDRRTKIDAMLDAMNAESDPEKKKQIEQRLRSLRASMLDRWMGRVADVASRIPILVKQFFSGEDPKLAEDTIRELAQLDPTGEQGKYLTWLVKDDAENNRSINERAALKEMLAKYHKVKNKGGFPADARDINKLSFEQLEKVVDDFGGLQSQRELALSGQRVVRDDRDWKITQITTVDSASTVCKGKAWCVKDPRYSENYLARGPLYFVEDLQDRAEYLIHPASGEVKDENNDTPVSMAPRLKEELADDPHIGEAISHMKIDVEDILRGIGDGTYNVDDIPTNDLSGALDLCMNEYENYGYYMHDVVNEMLTRDLSNLVSDYAFALNTATRKNNPHERSIGEEELVRIVDVNNLGEAVLASGRASMMAKFAVDVLKARWPQAEPTILANEDAKHTYTSVFPEEEALVPFYEKAPPGNPPALPAKEEVAPESVEGPDELALTTPPPVKEPGHWTPTVDDLRRDMEQGQITKQQFEDKKRQLTRKPWKLPAREFFDPEAVGQENWKNMDLEKAKKYIEDHPGSTNDFRAKWHSNLPYDYKQEFIASLRGRWLLRRAGYKDWSRSFLFDPAANPIPFPAPGQRSGIWGWVYANDNAAAEHGTDDLDELWFLVENDRELNRVAMATIKDPALRETGFTAMLPVKNHPDVIEFLKRNFNKLNESAYERFGRVSIEPGHEGDPFASGQQWSGMAKDVVRVLNRVYGEDRGAEELEKFLSRLKPGEREDFLEEAGQSGWASMLSGLQEAIDQASGRKRLKPSRKTEMTSEDVKNLPEVDVQTQTDQLLEQLQAEIDPEKKRQIEERLRSIQASIRGRWALRRAGEMGELKEHRHPGGIDQCSHSWPGKKPGESGWCGRCGLGRK